MTNVVARIKANGKNFEIIVDVDKAVELKEGGNVNINEAVEIDRVLLQQVTLILLLHTL